MKKLTGNNLRTPCYVVDQTALEDNLLLLRDVSREADCKILLAQKAFSMFSLYPLASCFLDGTTASGLYEARLGKEYFGGETHVFSPAFTRDEFAEILKVSDHLIFNSFSQWQEFGQSAIAAGKSCGMRVNPERPTQEYSLYDPCTPGSRLGVTRMEFRPDLIEGIEGLHFHCLCEQNTDALEQVLAAFEVKFGEYIGNMKWINFGGGHHITRPDYNTRRLIEIVRDFRLRYGVQVYLEPGEAIALNAGYLICSVVDIVKNEINIAVLDTSATCHMPDVLEMPYRPRLIDAEKPDEKKYTYRLGGPTCLAGDIIGDYSFADPLKAGDQLIFCDMAIYTMVKNNTFNGMRLPDIVLLRPDDSLELIRSFGYEDFKMRLS